MAEVVFVGVVLLAFALLVVTAVLSARHGAIQPSEAVSAAEVGGWPRFGAFVLDLAAILIVTALVAPLLHTESGGLFWAAYLPYFAVAYVLGATPAMRLFRMRVRTYAGGRVSIWRGIWRSLALLLVNFVCLTGIGFLLFAINRLRGKGRFWHDRATLTTVVWASTAH